MGGGSSKQVSSGGCGGRRRGTRKHGRQVRKKPPKWTRVPWKGPQRDLYRAE